jgi:predicted transcriptional regulator
LAKGLAEANRAIARKLLERGWPVDEVAAMIGLSRDEIQSLAR